MATTRERSRSAAISLKSDSIGLSKRAASRTLEPFESGESDHMKLLHGTVAALALASASRLAEAQAHTLGWGNNVCDTAWIGESFVEVSAGMSHTLARRSDGTLRLWGRNYSGECEIPVVPSGLSVVQLAGGNDHSLALRSDGSIQAWGSNIYGQCNVPALPSGLSYTRVAGGYEHSLALRSDGAVLAWGNNGHGECNVPALAGGLSWVDV